MAAVEAGQGTSRQARGATASRVGRLLKQLDLDASAVPFLAFHDWREQPVEEPVTADFVYVRRHGTSPSRYHGAYTEAMLRLRGTCVAQRFPAQDATRAKNR